jgi:hypothetical protein
LSSTNPPNSLTFATANEAKAMEDKLRADGASFRTQIVKTRKRGLEYRINIFDVA